MNPSYDDSLINENALINNDKCMKLSPTSLLLAFIIDWKGLSRLVICVKYGT